MKKIKKKNSEIRVNPCPNTLSIDYCLLTILFVLCGLVIMAPVSASLFLNSFNSGRLSEDMKTRHDLDRTHMGSETLDNILIRPQGMAYRRPGTEFIDWRIREANIPTTTTVTVGEYPTLQELTSGEIPSTPATPSDTGLVGESSVTNKAELAAMNGANHYSIDNDIDCSGGAWTPIANFSGVIEGNGNTISNLSITGSSDIQGMFSSLDTGAEIRNLNFENCSVQGDDIVGLLVARVDENESAVILKNITFTTCTLQGQYAVGFLVGMVGKVGGSSHSNRFYDCNVVSCDLTIDASSNYNGMLIGYFPNNASASGLSYIVRCSSQGGTMTIGTDGEYNSAFIGFLSSTPIVTTGIGVYDCYSTTDMTTAGQQYQLGSFGGKYVSVDVVSCYATGDITITVAGTQHNGNHLSAFIALYEYFDKCVNSYSTGNIILDGSANGDGFNNFTGLIGGFVGEMLPLTDANMIRCYSTSDITLVGEIRLWHGIGGFIGQIKYGNLDTTGVVIQRCWAEGDITLAVADRTQDPNGCGGFIGSFQNTRSKTLDTTIQNCYTWGSITYTDNSAANVATGGFFGSWYATQDADLMIDNCYCAQTDTAAGSDYLNQIPVTDSSGGFLGALDDTVGSTYTIADTFYDQETSGFTTDKGSAVNHLTSWLQTKSNYEDAGWDFTDIWILTEVTTEVTTYVTVTFGGSNFGLRLIPFEYSTDDAYVHEYGHKYIGFLRTE